MFVAAQARLDELQDRRSRALARLDEEIGAAEEDIASILDDEAYRGRCKTCRTAVFDDESHFAIDDYVECADHAPLLSDLVRDLAEDVAVDPNAWVSSFPSRANFDLQIEAWRTEIATTGDRRLLNAGGTA